MSVILEKYNKNNYNKFKKLKKLYITAFPAEERAPFFLITSKAKKGKADLLAAYDNDEFIGFAYMICYDDPAYIFYLAVDKAKRGHGYGGQIIEALKAMYKGKRIFLAREQLDESADNYAQRVSRHDFYLRCGFEDLQCHIKEASVIYDVMGIGGNVTPDEYDALITSWLGKLLRKFVDMRLIYNTSYKKH